MVCPYCKEEHTGFCPLLSNLPKPKTVKLTNKQSFQGKIPNLLVGSYNYPNVRTGLLSTEWFDYHDNPKEWSKNENLFDINSILERRSSLINANFETQVTESVRKKEQLLRLGQEAAMAKNPIDTEIHLKKSPLFKYGFSKELIPHGPSVQLDRAQLVSNPRIDTAIDKAVSDTDLKAATALKELTKKNIDEHKLTKLLSAGTLGFGKNRRLVPTRWSITAVDDILSKHQLNENYSDFKEGQFSLYNYNYFGNDFYILFLPGAYSFELIEIPYKSNTHYSFVSDYEGPKGRKTYASNCAGGYYAAKIATVEKKLRGTFICFRFITSDYFAPLGVWVVREAVRKALDSTPIICEDKLSLLHTLRNNVKEKYKIEVLNQSELLKQKTLSEY